MRRKGILEIIILVVFGSLLFITCETDPEEKNPFKGNWLSDEGYNAIFEDSTWYIPQYQNGKGLKGTYTYTDNTAQIIYTEITTDGIDWHPITSSEASSYTRIATVSGNTLTWGGTTYKRK